MGDTTKKEEKSEKKEEVLKDEKGTTH